jgi:hypothetical protein
MKNNKTIQKVYFVIYGEFENIFYKFFLLFMIQVSKYAYLSSARLPENAISYYIKKSPKSDLPPELGDFV